MSRRSGLRFAAHRCRAMRSVADRSEPAAPSGSTARQVACSVRAHDTPAAARCSPQRQVAPRQTSSPASSIRDGPSSPSGYKMNVSIASPSIFVSMLL
jgi:hypothetical protein